MKVGILAYLLALPTKTITVLKVKGMLVTELNADTWLNVRLLCEW